MTDRPVRVRFAPSPTGPLHVGGVRTALYNYLFAKQNKGIFILRIEDTDQNRYVKGAEEYIIESLKWAGIMYDEGPGIDGGFGPYRQSERKHLYRKYVDQLLESGHAYYAFDTNEDLEEMRERMTKAGMTSPKYDHVTRQYMKNSLTLPADEVKARLDAGESYAVRIKIPRNEEVKVHDVIRGWVTFHSNELDDKVLYKSDGMPTYHMANVVDDFLMEITQVIRGEEWLPSAPTHVLLYRYLGWEDVMPKFAHLPLLLKPEGNGKLSKRDGDRLGFPVFSLNWKDPETGEISSGYKEAGYIPSAYINLLALLGWHTADNREIFSLDELVEAFSLERVSKSGAKFDPEKAKWFNHQYMKVQSNSYLADFLEKEVVAKGLSFPRKYLEDVCGLIKEKATLLTELWAVSHFFFIPPKTYNEGVVSKKWDENAPLLFAKIKENFDALSSTDFTATKTHDLFEATASELGLKAGNYMQLFRVVISGEAGGPVLWDMVELLGKEEVSGRIESAIKSIQGNF